MQTGFADEVLARGGHLRVGLEDYEGERYVSNVDLVAEAVEAILRSGNTVATHDETRDILGIR